MFFRTTAFATNDLAIQYSSKYSASIQNYQIQISSGLKFQRSSDDPIAFRQASSLRNQLQELKTEESSINTATSGLNLSVAQLTEVNQLLVSARRVAQQGIQAVSDTEREALAIEAESILENLKTLSQTKFAGAFLYSGTRTDQVPFEFSKPGTDGRTLEVDYLGATENSRAYINGAISLDTMFVGQEIFGSSERQETLLLGDTGTKSGSGTDNIVGRASLEIRHTLTTFAAGSGVAAGLSSVGGDTIIGQAGLHQLTINDTSGTGAAGTISLNGGAEVPFTATDTDLKVVGKDGEVVFLDTTSITAGFNGTIDLTAEGTFSIDGGATQTPITFDPNQLVFDQDGQHFVNIDSTNTFRTGTDHLEFPGTSDVFQTMYELIQDLRNDRELDSQSQSTSIDRRLGELERLSDHVLSHVGQQSASLLSLEQLQGRNLTLALETETLLNEVQATDLPEAVLRMENDQTLLEYTYAVTAQINSVSLLNYLT